MLRRTLILVVAGGMASSCGTAPPALQTVALRSAPPAKKIERLLIWLPADDAALDPLVTANTFKSQLEPLGVAVQIGRSTALELSRADDQKLFIAGFKPTHRLEIDIAGRVGRAGVIGDTLSVSVVRVALYDATGATPLRAFTYGPIHVNDRTLAGTVVNELKTQGYL